MDGKIRKNIAAVFDLSSLLALGNTVYAVAIGANTGLGVAALATVLSFKIAEIKWDGFKGFSFGVLALHSAALGGLAAASNWSAGNEISTLSSVAPLAFWTAGHICALLNERRDKQTSTFSKSEYFWYGLGNTAISFAAAPVVIPIMAAGLVASYLSTKAIRNDDISSTPKSTSKNVLQRLKHPASSADAFAVGFGLTAALSFLNNPLVAAANFCWSTAFVSIGVLTRKNLANKTIAYDSSQANKPTEAQEGTSTPSTQTAQSASSQVAETFERTASDPTQETQPVFISGTKPTPAQALPEENLAFVRSLFKKRDNTSPHERHSRSHL